MKKHHTNTDPDGLNIREKLFCHLYLANKENGAQAARDAGYNGDVGTRAANLLSKPHIAAVIRRERARLVAKAELKAERVIEELMRIAFFRPSRLFRTDADGKCALIPMNELDEDTAAAISGVERRKGVLRLRFANKIQALDLLGRYLKLWEGEGKGSTNRLKELIDAMRTGPIENETIH
jgi:phage terminase small subunit